MFNWRRRPRDGDNVVSQSEALIFLDFDDTLDARRYCAIGQGRIDLRSGGKDEGIGRTRGRSVNHRNTNWHGRGDSPAQRRVLHEVWSASRLRGSLGPSWTLLLFSQGS